MSKIPGTVWVAIISLITALGIWVQGDYFAGQWWVPLVVIILGFIANVLRFYKDMQYPPAMGGGTDVAPTKSFWRSVLLG